MFEYGASLILALCFSALDKRSLVTCLIVGLNFMVNETFVRVTGIYDPWYWFGLADVICATALIKLDLGRVGAAVAGVYAIQTIMHAAYFVGGGSADVYWQCLTALGFIQLLIVATGGVGGGGRLAGLWRALFRVDHMGAAPHSGSAKRGSDR